MSRTGIARTRHIRHRSLERMRRQKTIPTFYAAEAVDLAGTGVTDDFVRDEATPVDFVTHASAPTAFTAANATEIMTDASHGLTSGQGPFQLTNSGGALPTGLAVATDYWVEVIDANDFYWTLGPNDPTPIAISDDGTGTHSYELVNGLVVAGHLLEDGQGPVLLTTSGTLPAGLELATEYWVRAVGADRFYLTLGPNDSTPVVVTDDGTGTHSFAFDNGLVAAAHGLVSGQGPFVLTTTTTLPAGLSETAQYWAHVLSVDKFYFTTAPKSRSPVPVTDNGTGTHSFALAAEVAADIYEINKRGVRPETIAAATDVDSL